MERRATDRDFTTHIVERAHGERFLVVRFRGADWQEHSLGGIEKQYAEAFFNVK